MNLPARVDEPDPLAGLVATFIAGRRSPHTQRAYRADLTGPRGWLTWATGARVDPFNARQAHVRQWLVDLEALGDSQATLARRLAAASSWYRWLIRQQVATYNPADLDPAERPVVQTHRSDTLALSEKQAAQLLEQADLDSPRTSALVALMLDTGARIAEFLAADIEDLTMRHGHQVLPITGKGRRKRTLPLPPPVYARLEMYLATRKADVERLPSKRAGAKPRRPLFATRTGKRMTTWSVHRTLRLLAERAGGDLAKLAPRMSPHVLRHTFISLGLEDGIPIDRMQDAAGHASPNTTRRYDHRAENPAVHPAYKRAERMPMPRERTDR